MKLTANIHRVGQPMNSVHLGDWRKEWSAPSAGPLYEIRNEAARLTPLLDQHRDRQTARVATRAGQPQDWRDRLAGPGAGLQREVAALRSTAQAARRASALADKHMADAYAKRQGLLPFDAAATGARPDNAADATLRASIRAQVATLPQKDRLAYVRKAGLNDATVRALLETDPELIGIPANEQDKLRERAMRERHGDVLDTCADNAGAGEYLMRLAGALETAVKAELADLGLSLSESGAFLSEVGLAA